MKTRILVVPTLLSVCLSQAAWCAENVNYSKVSWSGATAHVVSINLNSPDLKVTVSLAKNGRGSSESFNSMINRAKPAAAITGTFFCTHSLLPTGDIVIEGNRIHTGCVGTGVCITPNNKVEFVPYSTGHKNKWQGYETVLCAGPTLLRNGGLYLMPQDQGFHDPSLFGNKRRTAVGVTASNKLLFVAVDTPVQLRALARIMQHLGAVDAVDLDGGSSTALHCNGKTINRPGRSLTNLLVVYSSLAEYCQHREALTPVLRGTQFALRTEKPVPAQPTGTLVSRVLPDDSPITTSLTLLSGAQISNPGDVAKLSLHGSRTPMTDSSRSEPVLPDAEAAMISHSETETSLTAFTIKPMRRAQRMHDLMISSRLLTH